MAVFINKPTDVILSPRLLPSECTCWLCQRSTLAFSAVPFRRAQAESTNPGTGAVLRVERRLLDYFFPCCRSPSEAVRRPGGHVGPACGIICQGWEPTCFCSPSPAALPHPHPYTLTRTLSNTPTVTRLPRSCTLALTQTLSHMHTQPHTKSCRGPVLPSHPEACPCPPGSLPPSFETQRKTHKKRLAHGRVPRWF